MYALRLRRGFTPLIPVLHKRSSAVVHQYTSCPISIGQRHRKAFDLDLLPGLCPAHTSPRHPAKRMVPPATHLSCSHFHGAYSVFWRHLFSGMRRLRVRIEACRGRRQWVDLVSKACGAARDVAPRPFPPLLSLCSARPAHTALYPAPMQPQPQPQRLHPTLLSYSRRTLIPPSKGQARRLALLEGGRVVRRGVLVVAHIRSFGRSGWRGGVCTDVAAGELE